MLGTVSSEEPRGISCGSAEDRWQDFLKPGVEDEPTRSAEKCEAQLDHALEERVEGSALELEERVRFLAMLKERRKALGIHYGRDRPGQDDPDGAHPNDGRPSSHRADESAVTVLSMAKDERAAGRVAASEADTAELFAVGSPNAGHPEEDYRALNAILSTHEMQWPIILIDSCVDSMHSARYFTVMDVQ